MMLSKLRAWWQQPRLTIFERQEEQLAHLERLVTDIHRLQDEVESAKVMREAFLDACEASQKELCKVVYAENKFRKQETKK